MLIPSSKAVYDMTQVFQKHCMARERWRKPPSALLFLGILIPLSFMVIAVMGHHPCEPFFPLLLYEPEDRCKSVC
jgi:hypothetical protein